MRFPLLLFIPLLTWACQSTPKKESQRSTEPVEIAEEPKDFRSSLQLKQLDGTPIDMSAYQDKTLILNLWATWCGPCIKEMPDLQDMEATLGDDFVLLLASDEGATKINAFKEKRPFELRFVQIDNSLESLGVYSLPTTFVVGANGDLLETLIGARDWNTPTQIHTLKSYLP